MRGVVWMYVMKAEELMVHCKHRGCAIGIILGSEMQMIREFVASPNNFSSRSRAQRKEARWRNRRNG